MAEVQVLATESIQDGTPTPALNQWLQQLVGQGTTYRILPQLVAYFSHTNEQNYLAVCPDEERDNYRMCSTIPALLNAFPGVGSAAIIASDTCNVVKSSQAAQEGIPSMWHSAVVCRLQRKLYIFDPHFRTNTTLGLQLANLPGIRNVRRLVLEMMGKKHIRVDEILITGVGDVEQQCLRLCCRWLEELVKGQRELNEEEWYSVRR